MSGVLDGPVLGMTWGFTGVRGTWVTPAAQRSMEAMAALGTTWVTLAYAAVQATAQSTEIPFRDEPTLTDDEIRAAVARARTLGQKVCLKPMVDVADGTWRAHIGFFDQDVPGEPTWGQWFDSYTGYVLHHARLAAELDVEMFCVGCEMVRADAHEARWRDVIGKVREVYDGLVTYNCDKHQEDRLTWWDAVDVISSSGYYPSGTWEENLDRIEAVVRREGKPFVFLEAGCPSMAGSPQRPNDWTWDGALDQGAQAGWLDEMLTAGARRDWVGGYVLWDWPAEPYAEADGPLDAGYCVLGKEGAGVVARHYAAWGARPGALDR